MDVKGTDALKRLRFKFLTGLLLALGAALAAVYFWSSSRVGRPLDSYGGVTVYDNGLLFFQSHGKNFSQDGYYFGQKWQCVEFVKRFYYQAKNHRMPDLMGHAKSFFDATLPDGALNPRRGLAQYRNGSTTRPRADDLLVFTDTRYGHVGIVTQVGADSLEIIQQNIPGQTRRQFSLVASNGHYFVTSPRQPAGWLRR
jgi:surface antigen